MLHIALHFLVPLFIAVLCFKQRFLPFFLVMIATMVVDIDHLFADPIYDPNRCSIGFHPLHQPWFIAVYIALCGFKPTRWVGIGLVIHMLLDAADCI